MDQQDFEFIGADPNSSLVNNNPPVENGTMEKTGNHDNFMKSVKKETEPFKRELLIHNKGLKKLRSNLIDENDTGVDFRYKVASMKYDMMKKDREIDNLRETLKSLGEKLSEVPLSSLDPKTRRSIALLKKELELIELQDDVFDRETHVKEIDNPKLLLPKNQNEDWIPIYTNSCFHIINAILIIVVLSLYYNQDTVASKLFIAVSAVLIYAGSNMINSYQQMAATYNGKRTTSMIHGTTPLLGCTMLTLTLILFVALQYEDAHTFVINMVLLMLFAFGLNFFLCFTVIKIVDRFFRTDDETGKKKN